MSLNLQFKVNRTRNDYARAFRVFCWRSRILRAIWLMLAIFPAYLAVNLLIRFANGEVSEWSKAQSTLSFVSFVLFIFIFTYYLSPIISARSVPRQGTDVNVLVGDEGIVEINSAERTTAPWEMFTAALETTREFVLIRGQVSLRYYPKRTLDSQVIRQFRQAIGENIPRAKLLRSSVESGESATVRETINLETTYSDIPLAKLTDATDSHDSLNFELTLTAEDYKRAYRVFMRKSKTFAVTWIFVTVTYFYLISDNIVYLINGGGIVKLIVGILPTTILYILLMAYIYFWKPIRIARSAPDVGATYSVTVSDTGIAIRSNLGNAARYGWEKFIAATETANDFLLFRPGSQFNAYPKRMFGDPRDLGKFRDLIRQNVPEAKLLPSSPAPIDP